MPASPNSCRPSVSVVGATVSCAVAAVLTAASATPLDSVVAVPQHGGELLPTSHEPEVIQRESFSTGVPPPSKSYTINMSPGVRCTSPDAPQDVAPLLNSNATCAL